MNAQEKFRNGQLVGRGIQWTDETWNVIGGCKHRCRWTMPDGSVAICYAEEVAAGVAQGAYRQGFEHHYWHPHKLEEPLKVKAPRKIFLDSMADAFGRWVPAEELAQVLDTCRRAHWHTFQALTKNAPRILQVAEQIPTNVWVGASSPPDSMWGHPLSREQQAKLLHRILGILSDERLSRHVTWISFEPLSWDCSDIVAQYPRALRWAVIGAATNGPTVYQPNPEHVRRLLEVLDGQGVPVFFKGNLWQNPAAPAHAWREFFPGYVPSRWQGLIRAGRLDAHSPQKSKVGLADLQGPPPVPLNWQEEPAAQFTLF